MDSVRSTPRPVSVTDPPRPTTVNIITFPEPLTSSDGSIIQDSVRPVTSFSTRGPTRISIARSARRLMERSGVEPKRPKVSYWGGAKGENGVEIGQTEYITRLTALRDSLVDQEQLYLAQALDRLRIHSLTNKNSSFRLRMTNGNSEDSSPNTPLPPPQRRSMVTTVEKFRQLRPKRHHPNVLPLQGRQLIEPQGRPGSADNNHINKVGKENKQRDDLTSRSLPAQVDETVHSNLQRLLQPSSSIPNIGRKAIKQQEGLEPKTKQLLKKRTKLVKPTHPQMASPFLRQADHPTGMESPHSLYNIPHTNTPNTGYKDNRDIDVNGNLIIDSFRNFAPGAIKAHINMDADSIQDFCYDYYLSKGNNHVDDNNDNQSQLSGFVSDGSRRHGRKYQPSGPGGRNTMHRPHHNQNSTFASHDSYYTTVGKSNTVTTTHPPGPERPATTHNYQLVYSFDDGSDQEHMPSGRLPAIARNSTASQDHSEINQVRLANNYSDASGPQHYSKVNLETKFPGEPPVPHSNHIDKVPFEGQKGYERGSFDNLHGPERSGSFPKHHNSTINNSSKKHIVVAMPSIIFNSASPDVERITSSDHTEDQAPGVVQSSPHQLLKEKTLRKTIKQKEIRKRELQNLLEDVKELNMRTEAMSAEQES